MINHNFLGGGLFQEYAANHFFRTNQGPDEARQVTLTNNDILRGNTEGEFAVVTGSSPTQAIFNGFSAVLLRSWGEIAAEVCHGSIATQPAKRTFADGGRCRAVTPTTPFMERHVRVACRTGFAEDPVQTSS